MTEQFWQKLVDEMQPTTANPAFVTAEAVAQFGPIPAWLKSHYDLLRDGYYIGVDTPEAREIRVQRLREALAPYFEEGNP